MALDRQAAGEHDEREGAALAGREAGCGQERDPEGQEAHVRVPRREQPAEPLRLEQQAATGARPASGPCPVRSGWRRAGARRGPRRSRRAPPRPSRPSPRRAAGRSGPPRRRSPVPGGESGSGPRDPGAGFPPPPGGCTARSRRSRPSERARAAGPRAGGETSAARERRTSAAVANRASSGPRSHARRAVARARTRRGLGSRRVASGSIEGAGTLPRHRWPDKLGYTRRPVGTPPPSPVRVRLARGATASRRGGVLPQRRRGARLPGRVAADPRAVERHRDLLGGHDRGGVHGGPRPGQPRGQPLEHAAAARSRPVGVCRDRAGGGGLRRFVLRPLLRPALPARGLALLRPLARRAAALLLAPVSDPADGHVAPVPRPRHGARHGARRAHDRDPLRHQRPRRELRGDGDALGADPLRGDAWRRDGGGRGQPAGRRGGAPGAPGGPASARETGASPPGRASRGNGAPGQPAAGPLDGALRDERLLRPGPRDPVVPVPRRRGALDRLHVRDPAVPLPARLRRRQPGRLRARRAGQEAPLGVSRLPVPAARLVRRAPSC